MKRIVICCDGTWSKPGTIDRGIKVKTNVLKLYEALNNVGEDGMPQVKYYGQGVGTRYSVKDKLFGGISGKGIDRNIKDAYKFIMWNFVPGDELYLFGFSRGAYTARSLMGLIRNCGVMKPEFLHLVDEAFGLYRDRNAITHPDSDLMVAFKRSYSQLTRIRFIGVWDTVGSLGVPIQTLNWFNEEYQFHDVKLSSDVDYAYHAVALDEKRGMFEPTLWELSNSVRKDNVKQVMEQVWFPGSHCNVGGGYADSGLSDITLDWMIQKARATNLGFKDTYLNEKVKPDPAGEIRNSRTGFYNLFPKFTRQINQSQMGTVDDDDTGGILEYNMLRNEKIHYSCVAREKLAPKYSPSNLLNGLKYKTPLYPDLDQWKDEWKSPVVAPLLQSYLEKPDPTPPTKNEDMVK